MMHNTKTVNIVIFMLIFVIVFSACSSSAAVDIDTAVGGNVKLYILSTNAPDDDYILPCYNWGECMHNFIDTERVDIVNINIESNFENFDYSSFDKQLNENDYVLIQLGNIYNEPSKEDFSRIKKLNTIYNKWTKDIKKYGAFPIILTPNYISDNKSDSIEEYYENFSSVTVEWGKQA